MLPIQDYPAYLHELVFKEDATAYELLTIAVAFAVMWAVVFAIARPLLRFLTDNRPWLRAACERDWDRGGKEGLELWSGFKGPKEEGIKLMMHHWPLIIITAIQHVAGAMLCVPSLLSWGDPSWASSLAVCGVISEIGWEIEDSIERAYVRLFTENGEKKVNNGLIIVLALHHSLATGLGLPMVLCYRNLKAVHWLCFDLQIAGATILLGEYSRLLDISKANQLQQFKLINCILLALAVWLRLLHWVYLSAQVVLTWYQEEARIFLFVGTPIIALFSCFNAMFVVIPMYKRFMKFLHRSVEHESLPADVSATKRNQSAILLEQAASELLEPLDMTDRIELFMESIKGRGKLDRRQTMPVRHRMTWASVRIPRGVSVPDHILKQD